MKTERGESEQTEGAVVPSERSEKRRGAGRKAAVFLYGILLPVIASGLIRALGIYIFVTPNNFAPGGINGIAVLLEYGTGWNSGWFLIMLNVPLFFVAFFLLGKKEAIVSTASMLVSSGLLIAFPYLSFLPVYGGGDIVHGLLAAVAGGIFLGVALAVMLKSFGTSGGTTVLASLINKRFRNLSVSMLTSMFDACVVIASFFVYNQGMSFTDKLDPVLLALVSLFVTSKGCDWIVQGFKTAYKFEIVTKNPDEISAEIMQKLHHGVTKLTAEGMYSHEGKSLLLCLIRKRQIAELQRIIRKYPDTFAYFVNASEVYGKFLK